MHEVIASFRRVRNKGFAEQFYSMMLSAEPEIAARFAGTDLTKQKELLLHGIFSLLEFAQGKTVGSLALKRLSALHDRQHLNINPEWYEPWLRYLLLALKEKDPLFTDELAAQWIEALTPGISQMCVAY